MFFYRMIYKNVENIRKNHIALLFQLQSQSSQRVKESLGNLYYDLEEQIALMDKIDLYLSSLLKDRKGSAEEDERKRQLESAKKKKKKKQEEEAAQQGEQVQAPDEKREESEDEKGNKKIKKNLMYYLRRIPDYTRMLKGGILYGVHMGKEIFVHTRSTLSNERRILKHAFGRGRSQGTEKGFQEKAQHARENLFFMSFKQDELSDYKQALHSIRGEYDALGEKIADYLNCSRLISEPDINDLIEMKFTDFYEECKRHARFGYNYHILERGNGNIASLIERARLMVPLHELAFKLYLKTDDPYMLESLARMRITFWRCMLDSRTTDRELESERQCLKSLSEKCVSAVDKLLA